MGEAPTLDDLAKRKPKHKGGGSIVTLDIERVPGTFACEWRGMSVSGQFWDLGQHKRSLGRRIHADDVTMWPRTISVAWRWQGTRQVEFASEWGDGTQGMMRRVWEVYDRADLVQGHNLTAFDTKHIKAGWALEGWPPPSPWKEYDTLKVARRELNMESNTLDSLCKRFGLRSKTDKYDVATAQAACAGDERAQKKIERYNKGDIAASEALADYLRAWHRSHPFIGAPTGLPTCNRCGSTRLELQTKRYRAVVQENALYRCTDCGGHVKGGHIARVSMTQGVA